MVAATWNRSTTAFNSGSLSTCVLLEQSSPLMSPSLFATVADSNNLTSPPLMVPMLCTLMPMARRATPSPVSSSDLLSS